MSRPVVSTVSPSQLIALLSEHRKLWITPLVVATVLAMAYSLVMPRKWKATQGLLVRPEAAGLGTDRLGKFGDLSEMKTLQETLLELARSQSVVTSVLQEVGPASSWTSLKSWPTPQDVADFRDAMVMSPPGGAEFGKTEVFYLGVLDNDADRAAALTDGLAKALEIRTKEMRQARADSMIAELTNAVASATDTLNKKTSELAEFEGGFGASLNDLRKLLQPIGGSSESSQDNLAIQAELRSIQAEHQNKEQLLEFLRKAQNDPQVLVATPASLLAYQPAVQRLKQGLLDSQLRTARLLGTLAPSHPFVIASQETEAQVHQQLRRELTTAIQGLEIELQVGSRRQDKLNQQLTKNQEHQKDLARHRAVYSQLVSAVENQTQLVDAARTRLVEAEGHLAGAQSASLLSRIDAVESSLRPVGPGRSTVVAAGGLLGLLIGLGMVFIKCGPSPWEEEELSAVYETSHKAEFGFANSRQPQTSLSEAFASGYQARETVAT